MSDQVIAEIERTLADLDSRLMKMGRNPNFTCTTCYSTDLGWFVNAHFAGIRSRSESGPLTALADVERQVLELERTERNLARTLGLEAAE